jgi:hypothetical protein
LAFSPLCARESITQFARNTRGSPKRASCCQLRTESPLWPVHRELCGDNLASSCQRGDRPHRCHRRYLVERFARSGEPSSARGASEAWAAADNTTARDAGAAAEACNGFYRRNLRKGRKQARARNWLAGLGTMAGVILKAPSQQVRTFRAATRTALLMLLPVQCARRGSAPPWSPRRAARTPSTRRSAPRAGRPPPARPQGGNGHPPVPRQCGR